MAAANKKKEDDLAPAMIQSQGPYKLPDLVSHVKVIQPPSESVACLGCGFLFGKTILKLIGKLKKILYI